GRTHQGDEASRLDREAHVLEGVDDVGAALVVPGDVGELDHEGLRGRLRGRVAGPLARDHSGDRGPAQAASSARTRRRSSSLRTLPFALSGNAATGWNRRGTL